MILNRCFRRPFDELICNRYSVIRNLSNLLSSTQRVNHCSTCMVRHMHTDEDISKVLLDLEILDKNLFRSRHLLSSFPTSGPVYGGQVIGQALLAALETVSNEFFVHSLHCYFIKAATVKTPILYHVDRVRDGRSFCTRLVKAVQNGEAIHTCMLSFHTEEKPVIEHQSLMPETKPVETCRDAKLILEEYLRNPNLDEDTRNRISGRLRNLPFTFEVRPIDDECFMRRKPLTPKLHFWVKSKGSIGDDRRLHHCVSAYISDTGLIGASLLPHPDVPLQAGMTVSLDHAMWFHRSQYGMDEWMLYETESDIASLGRTFVRGKMWSADGMLMFSTAQESVVRVCRM